MVNNVFVLVAALGALGAHAAGTIKVPVSSSYLANAGNSLTQRDENARTTNAIIHCDAPVKVSSGQVFEKVIVDTGSAILWVGAQEPYKTGPATQIINQNFSIGYGVGSASGPAYIDAVSIGDAATKAQIIGGASQVSGLRELYGDIDGILGLGPSGTNPGEVTGFNSTPTFVETLKSEGTIDESMFGLFLAPVDSSTGIPNGQGEITFGGVDQSKIQGDVTWTEFIPPHTGFIRWTFNVAQASFGNTTIAPQQTPARTDSGVLLIGLPADPLFDIVAQYPGAGLESPNGFSGLLSVILAFPQNMTSTLPSIKYSIENADFEITPQQYLIPKALYPSLNLTDDGAKAYTWITSAGTGSFMFGQKWLETVYTAYDLEKLVVGFGHLA